MLSIKYEAAEANLGELKMQMKQLQDGLEYAILGLLIV